MIVSSRSGVLGILGAGRFSRLIESLAHETGCYAKVVCFDDDAPVDGQRVLGTLDDVPDHVDRGHVQALAIGIGYRHFSLRETLFHKYKDQGLFATLIHPSAFVSPEAEVAEACIVYSLANIESGTHVGPNVVVFNQTSLSHDVVVRAHSFFSVGINMGGGVQFGQRVFVGVGSTLINDISIGDDCCICAGTMVSKDLPARTYVVGNPMRTIRRPDFLS